MDTDKCLICQKHKENFDVVFQNDLISVSHMIRHPNESDNYLGYYMVESIRHFRGVYDATNQEIAAIGGMIKNLSKAMMAISNVAHVYVFIMGEGVHHFHAHVVARYKDAPKEYWGSKVDEWPEAPRGSKLDVSELNKTIRANLLNIIQK